MGFFPSKSSVPRTPPPSQTLLVSRNGSCVDSGMGWSVSIPIQELTVGYRQAERRRRHRFCCLWLMHGDSH